MLDSTIRPWIEPPLCAGGHWLARRGITAGQVTAAGFLAGLTAAAAVASGLIGLGLLLFLCGRLADGLDGAVARATRVSDRGGYLDIVLDFIVYAAFPLGFAVLDPAHNALAAAALLASFLANGSAFLAFAIMAERHGLKTTAQGRKSLFYLAGLTEGTETIVVFVAFCLFPAWFAWLATGFAAACLLSAAGRIAYASRVLS